MIGHTSSIKRTLSSFAAAAVALLLLVAPAHAASAVDNDVTGIEIWAANTALGEVGQFETSTNVVNYGTRGYGTRGWEWCGDFQRWVLERSGIPYTAGGRGEWNHWLATNWGVYGPRGFGRIRPGSAHDAVPGDFIVHNYPGYARENGHVSLVVKLTTNPAVVWTVGGNESDGVRLRRTNLDGRRAGDDAPRYLVTISEMRFPSSNLTYLSNTVGNVQFERTGGPYGPLVRVNQLKYTSVQYTNAQIDANYRLYGTNRDTGVRSSFMPRNWISTVNYRDIRLSRINSTKVDSAQVTYPAANLAGKPTSGDW